MFDHLFSLGESFFVIITSAPWRLEDGCLVFRFWGSALLPLSWRLYRFRNFLVNNVLLLAILPISRTLRKAGWNGHLVSC